MNNLLDFAGLLLYYAVMPLLLPVQAFLYLVAAVWFTALFCHRMLLTVPRWWGWLRHNSPVGQGRLHHPAWRKRLVKVHA